MNDYAIEDAQVERERLLVEGIHANAMRLYDFAVEISRSSNVNDAARQAAWALVAACNTYEPEPATVAREELP